MAERRFLICGGCGFIGSNFTQLLLSVYPESDITVADLLTYAGSRDNLGELYSENKVRFVKADICDPSSLQQLFVQRYDLVVNFAAETHVDRSLYYPSQFVQTNIMGTDVLMSLCRENSLPFLQISTDEVYGPTGENERFAETAALNPTSPYAASKAAGDLLVQAAIKTFRQDAAIVRTSNNYGPRQFPEKLIPFFIHLIRNNQPLPVYGDGQQRRSWLYVEDFCRALLRLVDDFPSGQVFNIGGSVEHINLEVVRLLADCLGVKAEIMHVADRPAHDRRYCMDSAKYEERYGAIPRRELRTGLAQTVKWYLEHPQIFDRMQSRENVSFRDTHYRRHR